nr:ABC transporter G family member 40 [Ziziphus jujuba var. spinosa]
MILPFEPHFITVEDIAYSVDMPKGRNNQGSLRINWCFSRVSGAAGKTTLMDVLAGRKTGGYMDKTSTISGLPTNQHIAFRSGVLTALMGVSAAGGKTGGYITVLVSQLTDKLTLA